jgi:hypothetical protein
LGMLHLAFHEIFLGREGNLVSIKSASSRFSLFAALPCQRRRHIMQIRYPGCVPRNYLQLWYSFLSLEMKIRSLNRPWKIICWRKFTVNNSPMLKPCSLTEIHRFSKSLNQPMYNKYSRLTEIHRQQLPHA